MNTRRIALLAVISASVLVAARGGIAGPPANEADRIAAADAKILSEIHERSEVMQNLEYLSDNIGPRLTGSPQLKQANEWTRDMFQKYGLANAHLEPWTISHGWARETARAGIVSPAQHPLTIAAAGWSPSTPGAVRGPVVYFDAKKKEDFAKFHGKLKGAIVIYQEPQSLSPPRRNVPSPILRPMQAPPPAYGEPPAPSPFAAEEEAANARTKFLKEEGVAAVLRDSNKPHGLLNMTDVSKEPFDIGEIPTAFVTGEGYRMIWRMMKHGTVEVEIEIKNSFSDKPVEVYNTVAEIRGSGKPEEVVILGAHLDSWDLGTGSTDNGTGSMAVLEAARALSKLGLKPKRTIRFVLFTGEEEGLVGSKRYVEAHKNDLEKISGVLVHDTGTGRVLTLGLHDNYQDREIVDQVLAPLSELKLLEPSMVRAFGTDHASFDDAGVPGFWCIQNMAEYSKTHHSQSDTFDKVWKDGLDQGAQVLAAWAYNTAELPAMLPRRPLPYQPTEAAAKAEAAQPDPVAEMDAKILAQVKTDQGQLQADLSYLADRIGPRLTGTAKLDQASHWTMEQFKALGLENAHLEPWTIANGWTRGSATGKLIAPNEQELTLAAAGWSPSTSGTAHGAVVGVGVQKLEDLQKYKGKLKGAIVLLDRPGDTEPPSNPMLTPFDASNLPLDHPKNMALKDFRGRFRMMMDEAKFLKEEGAAAVLLVSEKWYGLMNMGTGFSREYQLGLIPSAYMTRENATLLWRLLDGGPVEAEINIQGTFSGKPVTVYNTVAEIKGSEKPDEVVIIGGHLDSWDLGTGATDNGTGSMAVLAAARALVKSGVKPKRTIRFVLFTGEEQGLNGSKAYVAAHKDELSKISGVLVHDTGTGKVLTIGLMHNYAARETMDRVLYPLAKDKSIGLAEPSLRSEGGSDHVPFDAEGVPASWCIQEVANYEKDHHSQADTLDRVKSEERR